MGRRSPLAGGIPRVAGDAAELRTALVHEFQDQLHHGLQAFVNGDFVVQGNSRRHHLRPLRLPLSRVPWYLFESLGAPLRSLQAFTEVPPVAATALAAPRGGWLTLNDAARLFAELHRVLDGLLVAPDQPPESTRTLRRYDPGTYRSRGLTAVERLAAYAEAELSPYLKGLYLHGSLSTLDYTAYSDVDDLLVLGRETVLDGEALQRCVVRSVEASRFLYDHDPLQHHRHYVVTEIDLRSYPQAYLPAEVLRFATTLIGPDSLPVVIRESDRAHRTILRETAAKLARWETAAGELQNIWHLKNLLSAILLLPVLYLETQGVYCYKKFSFDLARPALATSWGAVEIASAIREGWDYRPGPRERLLRAVVLRGLGNPVLFQHLMAKAAPPIPGGLRDTLRRHDFYRQTGMLGRLALRLLDEGEEGAR